MLSSNRQVVKFYVALAMVLHFAASAPVQSKSDTSAVTWPRKCLKLKFYTTSAERAWRAQDKLHAMVEEREIAKLKNYLRKDMLKGQKPAPEPYLITATRIIPHGASHYEWDFKKTAARMDQNGDEVFRLLLWAGANPDDRGIYQTTALMNMSAGKLSLPKASPRIVKRLLEAGANPNLRNTNGWTALMYASEDGASDIATLLLKHKARTDFKNCAGQTAADIAAAKGHKALAIRLRP